MGVLFLRSGAKRCSTPPPVSHRHDESQPPIPQRVGLHRSPPPLQRPVSSSRQPAGTVNLHPSGWGNFQPAKCGIFRFFRTFGERVRVFRGRALARIYAADRTRRRRRSNFARPYIDRLISLRRCTFPSTGPLLHLCFKAASTAASSRHKCFVKEASGLCSADSRQLGQAPRSRSRTIRKNSRASSADVAISGDLLNNSSK